MIAHVDMPGSVPWIDEFFGHPDEYWPVYLFIATILAWLVYLTARSH